MKIKTLTTFFMSVSALALIMGCGMLGDKGVPKEQINSDLADKTVKFPPSTGGYWDFKQDFIRCFAPTPNETKITESGAEIMLDISSTREPGAGKVDVMFGKFLVRYKKDNGKWTLVDIEPKQANSKLLDINEGIEFAKASAGLCKYFRHESQAAKK